MKNDTNTTRQSIAFAIKQIRAARVDRSIPCMMGQGFTVCMEGSNTGLQIVDRKRAASNMAGRWNNGCSYWDRNQATKIMAELSPHYEAKGFKLEVIHHNDLRDREEKTLADLVKFLFPVRNITANA